MKTRAERCRSRRGVKGTLSWVITGQQSAPVGLEWFPASLGKHFEMHWPGGKSR